MMSPRSVSEDENERCVRSLRTWKSARRLGVAACQAYAHECMVHGRVLYLHQSADGRGKVVKAIHL